MAEATLVMETDAVDTENAPAGASVADLPVHLRAKEVSVTRRLYRGGEGEYFINKNPNQPHEAGLLKLDISKAKAELNWSPKMNASQAVEKTINWYKNYYSNSDDDDQFNGPLP